jgi:uncharacterized membrane protein YvbJ
MPYCHKCGTKINETMTFCPKCGAALKVTEAGTSVHTEDYVSEKSETGKTGETRETRKA